jgi:ABC-2 type transport system ATP-binding protein
MSIVVQEVTKIFGSQKALDNISFEIKTGEIAGFLGPNGAGKSTMMKIITGFIPATSGRVFVNGNENMNNDPEARKQLGYLPENNPLYPDMYVREYLGFVASVYRTGKPVKQQVDTIIEVTGLATEQNKKIGSLSKGYRQRVGLAQALIHNPSVLILDEATTGLDPNQIVEIRNLIRKTGKEKTVMLSTHIMQEVEAICDRVIIIDNGKIVANEEKDDIYGKIKRPLQTIQVEFSGDIGAVDPGTIPGVLKAIRIKDSIWQIEASGEADIRPEVFRFAVSNNLTVLSLQRNENNLEEVFRQLTGG